MSEPLPSTEQSGLDTNVKPGAPVPPMPSSAPMAAPTLAYQAVSGWAIAGFALGGIFALMVVVCALISFYQGAPFFLYQWLVGLAILGVFVSLYAQRHVRAAEGTLTGAKLAQWGFWLSLVSGILYCTYYLVTGYAITSQANAFVMEEGEDSGFFPRLRKGGDNPIERNKAFLLTQPPGARNIRPDDEKSLRRSLDISKEGSGGYLTLFRETSILPRILFGTGAKDAEITALDVQDWRYEKGSYRVERLYHIKTREIELDYLLIVQSAEGESTGQGRKWYINLRESHEMPGTPKPTALGLGLSHLRRSGGDYLTRRAAKVADKSEPLDLSPRDFDQTPWEALAPKDHVERRTKVYQAFAGQGTDQVMNFKVSHPAEMPGKWEQVEGRIRVHLLCRGAIAKDSSTPPSFMFEAVAAVETKQVIDPAAFTGESIADWSLVSIDFRAISVPEDKRLPSQKKDPR